MTALHETAYPRIRTRLSPEDLQLYTPTADEQRFAQENTRAEVGKLGLLMLLKVAQRLGYFPMFKQVPAEVKAHIAGCMGAVLWHELCEQYEASSYRWRHVPLLREYLGIRAFSEGGDRHMIAALIDAAKHKDVLADLINSATESLVEARFELPAFSWLRRAARKARAQVNLGYYQRVVGALTDNQRATIQQLLTSEGKHKESAWQRLKREPKQPTNRNMQRFIAHLHWLKALNLSCAELGRVPESKGYRFVEEARAMNVTRLSELQEAKRLTLTVALVNTQHSQALDDLAEMVIRKVSKMHRDADDALERYQLEQRAETEALLGLLQEIAARWHTSPDDESRLRRLSQVLGDNSESILERCERQLGYAGNNYLPFLPPLFRGKRKLVFDALELLIPKSTSTDRNLERALRFILEQRYRRGEWLPVEGEGNDDVAPLDLSWIPPKWWRAVTGQTDRAPVKRVHRKYFELCVISCVVIELKSGDLYIDGADQYGDYRHQLLDWEQYHRLQPTYCPQVGLAATPAAFSQTVQTWLADTIHQTDAAFPKNTAMTLKDGELVAQRVKGRVEPEGLAALEALLSKHLLESERSVVDILTDTEHWLNWSRTFKPVSGFEGRLSDAQQRYIATTLCYGCQLGPTQTARSLTGLDRRQVAYVNQFHITEQSLIDTNTEVVNAYHRCALPKLWGTGASASADGTRWDVYQQNLLAEYHLRYGSWGGIGYYHVTDTYVAIFSSFIACGVWEAIYILDGLMENESDLRPDTLYADTQGQSETVFGLAYLLAIKLMPRIRNWKRLKFYLPNKVFQTQHLQDMFDEPINWQLIERHYHDMMRVAVSISQGTIRASTILRKLNTYSRKNKLFLAFRELGRAVRTVFLLNLVNSEELRRTVETATNTSEAWNNFVQWLGFGSSGLVRASQREQQRKIIRYNHLVGNLTAFHNVVSMTKILQGLIDEGYPVTAEQIARLSPYRTEHINRFGQYELRLDQMPSPLETELRLAAVT
ncbi:MAG: Tn3 family transposase [Deinococcota bacterium]|nr:Tn3 family transposase [Deinococcota bacterium]